jgi:hypothetical protein
MSSTNLLGIFASTVRDEDVDLTLRSIGRRVRDEETAALIFRAAVDVVSEISGETFAEISDALVWQMNFSIPQLLATRVNRHACAASVALDMVASELTTYTCTNPETDSAFDRQTLTDCRNGEQVAAAILDRFAN